MRKPTQEQFNKIHNKYKGSMTSDGNRWAHVAIDERFTILLTGRGKEYRSGAIVTGGNVQELDAELAEAFCWDSPFDR